MKSIIPLLWRGGENFKEIFDGVVLYFKIFHIIIFILQESNLNFYGKDSHRDSYGMTNFVFMTEFEMKDRKSSPDCSGNPFLKKKIVTESGKKLLKSMEDESGNFIGLKIDFSFVEMTNSMLKSFEK